MAIMAKIRPKKKRINNKSTGRNYAKEYANYDGTERVKKKRAQRNKARRAMMRKGLAKKGDGMDVDHIDSNAMNSDPSNWRMKPASKNRSYPRTKSAREKKRPGKHVAF